MATNRFVRMYKNKLAEGKSIEQAFISVTSHLAWTGDIEDLQQLEEAYWKDFRIDFDQKMKELGDAIYEQSTSAV
ncbi:hypothetical protein [Oceanobacillus locisalsi]|uniref:Uncharacterized protein n=1 Tax=Oceanobacillus locisalsi TaxID=546107 RepID=A0ABW3NHV6_9BACI